MKLCFRGRRELTAYIGRCDLALGDSEYNRQELQELGFPSTGVLPVVPDFTHLDAAPGSAQSEWAERFDDEITNVMFVGRVIPNKKFEDVIRAFHVYRTRHNPRSRLLLVGSYSGFERYLAMLHSLVARLGTPDVHFLGHVSNEELAALYDVADVFLCASEHEGFCVPLIEAFYKRVPVLAYAATAVPATMDGGGVLYDTKDPMEVARLLDAVASDATIEDEVLRSQDAALDRLREARFRRHAAALSRGRPPQRRLVRRPRWRGTSGTSSINSSASRNSGNSGRPCIRRCRKIRAGARDSGLGTAGQTPREPALAALHIVNRPSSRAPEPPSPSSRRHDRQPVGPGGAQGRCDWRQRPSCSPDAS